MSAEVNVASLSVLRNELAVVANEHLAFEDAAHFCALARPTVRLVHSEQAAGTHLGGSATLDAGQAWPRVGERSLALVVVLDLAEVSRFVVDVELPDEGYLNFFYDAEEQSVWGFEPDDNAAWRVIYAAPTAVEFAPPPDSPSYPEVPLIGEQDLTIPGWEEPVAEPLFPAHAPPRSGLMGRRADRKDQARRDAYFAVQDSWRGTGENPDHVGHQIGGWPALQQSSIWRECDLVSQGYPLGTSEQWNEAEQAGTPDTQADWRLLLQVESDDVAGWMWGDVGALYYTVRSSELPPIMFERGWMILQCG